jgi:iron complex outermembrane receptor protein
MKKQIYLFIFLMTQLIYAQDGGSLNGTITDENGMPISGATVKIEGLKKGAITDEDGKFVIDNVPAGNYKVVLSFVGFESLSQSVAVQGGKASQLNLKMQESFGQLDEVVISANKKPQKITDVPATVNIIKTKEIEQFSSFNLGELASRQKGVDFVRTGVLGTGINIRGFNSAFNSKNLQITDDRLSSLVATGLPLGSMETVTKDDVERVEILLGPNGTLY